MENFVIKDKRLVKYIGQETYVSIPNGIITLSEAAFKNNNFIHSVKISDTVSIIEDECFCECLNLKTIVFPINLDRIGQRAFKNCKHLSTNNLQINDDTEVAYDAFDGCPEKSINNIKCRIYCENKEYEFSEIVDVELKDDEEINDVIYNYVEKVIFDNDMFYNVILDAIEQYAPQAKGYFNRYNNNKYIFICT